MRYLLYNHKSDNNHGEEDARKVIETLGEEWKDAKLVDLISMTYEEFLPTLTAEDKVVLFGGDGTINYCANHVYGKELPCPFYLHRAGTGNDFATDNADAFEGELLPLNKYLKKLPKVTVNGQTLRFVNGVGFGIDGMCCQVADEKKEAGAKKIDYTSITISLLLFKYKRPNATITVDGKEYSYKKVYLSSSMIGRFYGGGMNVAPKQNRFDDKLSLVVFYGKARVPALMAFTKIFKGELVNDKKCDVITGKKITVTFDQPTALQVDGEVFKDVTTYTAEIE